MTDYLVHIGIIISIQAILALSLNLVIGEAGLLSVAQGAFYGIGAYGLALLMLDFHVNFFLAVALGMVGAGVGALIVGVVFSRFRGDYYALGTIGFASIFYSVVLNLQDITGGPLGLPGIPRPELGGISFFDNVSFLVLSLIALAFVYGVCRYLTASAFGRVLHGIREDEGATAIFGYNPIHFKLAVFVISAALSAIGGALFASYFSYIDPSSFVLFESVFLIAVVVLGGLGSHEGAILGAVLLVVIPEALRFVGFSADIAAQMRLLVYGVVLVLLMLYRPQGLLGRFRI
ncbi:MAG: branched-chain amino acid ABC transporter permease [Patescibacteria group bacterium]|nr:branched-chain amino acid ABC transporter permease [Patescibacteria group bacterium]